MLNRPEKLNGVDLGVMALIAAATASACSTRAVILPGNGKAFCAGIGFGSVPKKPSSSVRTLLPSPFEGTNAFQEANWVWRELPIPVIAVRHGHVFGAGLGRRIQVAPQRIVQEQRAPCISSGAQIPVEDVLQ